LVNFDVSFAYESYWNLTVAFDKALGRFNAEDLLSLFKSHLMWTPEVVFFAKLIEVSLQVTGVEFKFLWAVVDQESAFFHSLAKENISKRNVCHLLSFLIYNKLHVVHTSRVDVDRVQKKFAVGGNFDCSSVNPTFSSGVD